MKNTILKLTTITMFAAAIAGTTTLSRAADSTAPAASGRFGGSISAVDTNANTITIQSRTEGEQTFKVTAETQYSKISSGADATPATATFADVVAGGFARLTYTTGADGKMTASKVVLGKKAGNGAGGGKGGGGKKGGGKKNAAPAVQ